MIFQENLVTERKVKPMSMNAFELISRSQTFCLDSLFEKQMHLAKRQTSFASQCPPNEIISKIEDSAKPLGFNVAPMKLKGDKSGRKGELSVATEVFEVAPCLHMVEFRKTGGHIGVSQGIYLHSNFYKSFSSGLKDIIWNTEGIPEEE
ncbi:CBL-interacting serine/threonine-protein kinase 9-like [Gossypium hirsutum]|uniref:non-specific serine/threonine protein kinase n=1 Tax=Gossypium hirsutum TaxID=3635 RepID=A0ABM2ZBQ5_GOSHI|nr:CBL-interacting serine/threonine-protein kinase 9-like [Gossypium hirsutum]